MVVTTLVFKKSLNILATAVAGLILLPAQVAGADSAGDLSAWAEGPVQWLFLADERKELKRTSNDSGESDFIDKFWARRDPQPEQPGNEFRAQISQRFDDADVLYSDEAVRGSLTDRGRALILLGPPTHVSVASRPALAWDTAEKGSHRVTTRQVTVEMWGYRLEDLPVGFLELWQEKKKAAESTLTLTLRFRAEPNRTVLIEGEGLLEIAAAAAVYELETK